MSSSNKRPANSGFRSVFRCAITHYHHVPSLSAPEPLVATPPLRAHCGRRPLVRLRNQGAYRSNSVPTAEALPRRTRSRRNCSEPGLVESIRPVSFDDGEMPVRAAGPGIGVPSTRMSLSSTGAVLLSDPFTLFHRPAAKAPNEPPNPTRCAPPLDSTQTGPVSFQIAK